LIPAENETGLRSSIGGFLGSVPDKRNNPPPPGAGNRQEHWLSRKEALCVILAAESASGAGWGRNWDIEAVGCEDWLPVVWITYGLPLAVKLRLRWLLGYFYKRSATPLRP
jgi:hypothetical protein